MKSHRIALIVSLACLLAAVVWVLWPRGGEERAAKLNMDPSADSPQNSGSSLTPDAQTPVQAPPQETLEAAVEIEETPAKTKSAPVQYNFQSWEDAMGAYAEIAGLAYDRLKAEGAPESAFAVYNALLKDDPDKIEHLRWTRENRAEAWMRSTAVEEAFAKLQTDAYKSLLDAMEPFLNDIPVHEWASNYVLYRAGRVPISAIQDLIPLPNGEVIDWNQYRHPHKLVVKFRKKGKMTEYGTQKIAELEAKAADPSTPLTEMERMELENLRAPGYVEFERTYQKGDESDEGFEVITKDLGVIE